tara:strand:+ start:20184 stop:20585 length:402 start_codon:yes stop_codon:yes gene_type:complete
MNGIINDISASILSSSDYIIFYTIISNIDYILIRIFSNDIMNSEYFFPKEKIRLYIYLLYIYSKQNSYLINSSSGYSLYGTHLYREKINKLFIYEYDINPINKKINIYMYKYIYNNYKKLEDIAREIIILHNL